MPDQLRGPTPHPVRRDPSGPHSIASEDTTRRLSPAETSQVTELVTALMAQVGDVVQEAVSRRTASDESMTAARAIELTRGKTRTYRGAIGALGAALVAAITWGMAQVEAYGDSRAEAARTAIAAEAKAEAAERSAQATAELAQATAERVDRLEQKIDRLLDLAGDR